MTLQNIHIIPYDESLHEDVMFMEKGISQGTGIQLEILKDHFLDRAKVFCTYYSNLAMVGKKTIGAAIGAATTLVVNGENLDAGFAFDAKVMPSMRKKGIGKLLANDLYKNFFRPNGLEKCFMTAKLTNIPILKMVSKAVVKVWFYQFVYLTIPTSARIDKKNISKERKQQFAIGLFNANNNDKSYFTLFEKGIGYFHTWKMYRLRVKKINWIYKQGIAVLKIIAPSRYKKIPSEGNEFSFATLFNHNSGNINSVGEVLNDLKNQGIHYLLICCKKNDAIYNYMKPYSINTYNYYLVSDFCLKDSDSVSLDVRCL
ncbi:MAG: hypothetical protein E6Q95_04220 [Chitinophagaceae bacterium]|nr:MAG: hypothetical protein E6Q95_04220 [Chitinophagaceae bacterium]